MGLSLLPSSAVRGTWNFSVCPLLLLYSAIYLGKIKNLQWFGSLILISTLVMTWEMFAIERLISM